MVKMDKSNSSVYCVHTVYCVCVFVCVCAGLRVCTSVSLCIHFFFFMCSRRRSSEAWHCTSLLVIRLQRRGHKMGIQCSRAVGKGVNRGMSREWEKWRKGARMTGETERERTQGSRRGQMTGRGKRGRQNDTWISAVSKREKLWQD